MASRALNSDLSPLDAQARSPPSLAPQLTIQYVDAHVTGGMFRNILLKQLFMLQMQFCKGLYSSVQGFSLTLVIVTGCIKKNGALELI